MFPLGSVLFPFLPLQLRVFEERYLMMLSAMLQAEASEFGVVLIERGQEVGGGEHRFPSGTVAQLIELGREDDHVALVAQGERRFEVERWLPEEPYPRAEVRAVPELVWDAGLQPLRDEAERVVRRSLAVATEFTELEWPADVELSEDPVRSAWQLAGIAPVGPLDQVKLLRSASMEDLLRGVLELTAAAAETFDAGWPEMPPGLDEGD